jgi:hypothetical protein
MRQHSVAQRYLLVQQFPGCNNYHRYGTRAIYMSFLEVLVVLQFMGPSRHPESSNKHSGL